ncbi:MAG: S1 RNA-binding domain-containing protein [Endomicrobia bacterium]|nr:S1 RNA-binding domain-containing protein [Endomicrobiia bacterium]
MNKFDHTDDIIPEDIYKYTKYIENIKSGEIVEGKIIEVTTEGIYVDIGSKVDGFIPKEEFGDKDLQKMFKPHQFIKVYVVKVDNDNVHLLSYKKAKEVELSDQYKENFERQTPLDAKIVSKISTGYNVDIGVDAFLPYREIGKELRQNLSLEQEGNIVFKVVIKDFKLLPDKRPQIVVSNKLYEEIVREEIKSKIFTKFKEGDEVIGVVKNITDFGAFVEVDGYDMLLHISDIAWYKVNHPNEKLHCGDKIKVKILKMDVETGKVSVGMKQLFPHPWEEVDKKYTVGEIVKCKIKNITKFGLFVELEPGVEGLVHISEVSWEDKNPNLQKMFKPGQEIKVKIINIDKQEHKIALSIKKVLFNPWEEIKKNFPPGSVHKGRITKIMPYGIFVSIKPGFDGLVHISNISWTERISDLRKKFREGDYVEYKVLDVMPEQESAVLSIKHLFENPYEKYNVGSIVKCKIKKVLNDIMVVKLYENIEGIITKKEAIIDKKDVSKDLKSLYKPGQEVEAVVISSDETKRRIELSLRQMEKILREELIKKYSEVKHPTLKDILTEE